jgi:hypothetical protein
MDSQRTLPGPTADRPEREINIEITQDSQQHSPNATRTSSKQECGWTGSTSPREEIPITSYYLTWNTELPVPAPCGPHVPYSQEPPDEPNISRYRSPFDWSEGHKSFILWLSCIVTAGTAYSAGSYAPAIDQFTEYFHVSEEAAELGVTVFTVGFGAAPMILAPLSEIKGRKPVFIGAGVLLTC